jgi:hypothetical protein
MMKPHFILVFLSLASVFMLAASCTDEEWVIPGQPTPEQTATEVPFTLPPISYAYDEATIRYILADAELGGVIDYYRQFLDQPNVAEAICRWDNGVRVQNLSNFERKIVGDQGWKIVYTGTENLINGLDVVLSSDDTCASSSGGNTTQSFCNNPYWPLISGAYWEYGYDNSYGSDFFSFGTRIEVPAFDADSNSLTLLGDTNL